MRKSVNVVAAVDIITTMNINNNNIKIQTVAEDNNTTMKNNNKNIKIKGYIVYVRVYII